MTGNGCSEKERKAHHYQQDHCLFYLPISWSWHGKFQMQMEILVTLCVRLLNRWMWKGTRHQIFQCLSLSRFFDHRSLSISLSLPPLTLLPSLLCYRSDPPSSPPCSPPWWDHLLKIETTSEGVAASFLVPTINLFHFPVKRISMLIHFNVLVGSCSCDFNGIKVYIILS